ncbi:TetR/AcrR family transcriptional regulator [Paenibacillus mesotrionivorans]|uniref:TetR/AcrR family transcriptional regulator n=1 Tax=Paenibacillus mesotrionivorans TaxID=3160968 RepID=A0ACC7NQC4_9BACL
MNKKKLQTEQTKKKIADASRALFIQKGYKATSIEDIVKATSCSAGNIYYHFKSKESLFLYLIEDWNREWEETWLVKEPNFPTVVDKLYGLADHLALDQLNHPLTKAIDEFYNNTEKPTEVEDHIHEIVQDYLAFNRQLLQRGIDNGELQGLDLNGLAVILDSLFLGLSQHTRNMSRQETLDMYRLAIDVFLRGVATA